MGMCRTQSFGKRKRVFHDFLPWLTFTRPMKGLFWQLELFVGWWSRAQHYLRSASRLHLPRFPGPERASSNMPETSGQRASRSSDRPAGNHLRRQACKHHKVLLSASGELRVITPAVATGLFGRPTPSRDAHPPSLEHLSSASVWPQTGRRALCSRQGPCSSKRNSGGSASCMAAGG